MRSLWVVNKCCGAMHEHIYNKKSTGGLWLDVALNEAKQSEQDRIIVVNVEKIGSLRKFQDGNTTYYTIPGEPNANYDYKAVDAKKHWAQIIVDEKPDNIVLWGTEFPYGLAAMNAAPEVPAYVYIQGILDSIAKYYTAGLTKAELRSARTVRDLIKGDSVKQTQKAFARHAAYEKEIIERSKHAIIENQWSLAYLKKIYPAVIEHIQYLPIAEVFSQYRWNVKSYKPHTIMCPAADYPIKGLHMLLKAINIVKQRYPDVQLIIPGHKLNTGTTLRTRIRQNGYDRLISDMIVQLNLQSNVYYTGRLTAVEMAEHMAVVNCFAVCSAIENHSGTLKEAMMVGAPCVASYVGGIPEYAENDKNALLYRYEDYEMLAKHIMRLFEDKAFCKRLSDEAVRSMSGFKQDESGFWGLRKIIADGNKL